MKYTQTLLVTLGISTILASPPQPENDSSAIKRFKRQCSTNPVYDVSCHGLCPKSKNDRDRNAMYLNCGEGQYYHCAREAKTGMLTEACATPVYCGRGKEPRIQFQPGNVKIADIICKYCDDDRYHPFEERRSDTFSQCLRNRTACTQGQVECDVVSGVERTWTNTKCTCDARNGFWPPEMGTLSNLCTSESHVCAKLPKCNDTDEELLQKDFTCGRKCDKGFARIGLSDDCVPVIADVSAMPNITADMNGTTTTMPGPIVTISVSSASTTTETTSPENVVPAGPQSGGQGKSILVPLLAGILIAVPVIVIVIVVVLGYRRTNQEPECTRSYLMQILCWWIPTREQTGPQESIELPVTEGNATTEARASDLSDPGSAEPTESDRFLDGNATTEATASDLSDPDEYRGVCDLTDEEKRRVLDFSLTDLKSYLDPVITVDKIREMGLPFPQTRILDMHDYAQKRIRTEANGFIVDQLRTHISEYENFKQILRRTNQKDLYKILIKNERKVRGTTETADVDETAEVQSHPPTPPSDSGATVPIASRDDL